MADRRRNDALAHWVARAQSSYSELATELQREARRAGHHDIAPGKSRVGRWINDGEQPRSPVPELLAATLTRMCRLPRPLTPTDLGFARQPRTPAPSGGWFPHAVMASILNTTRSDAVTDDDTPSSTPLLSARELRDAVQPWLHLPDPELPPATRAGRIGMSDVRAIQRTTDAFRALDNAHGGGLSRRAVVGQLHHVTSLLHHGRTTDEVGRHLFVAVADLASVAGWMTHDVGRHAEAQHYLLLGLQAAKSAGPAGAGIAGHLLNCLSRQANHLERHEDALDLVQAAQYGTRKLPPGRLRALLSTLEARCLATLGQLPESRRSLAAADDALAADDPDAPTWARWFDRAEHGVTVGVCDLIASDHAPDRAAHAVQQISSGTAHRPAERTRSRAFDQIVLARAHTRTGDLEAADAATAAALDLFGHVTSTRIADRLRELDRELSARATSRTGRATRERIHAALARP
ncbi:transcriptional regulator [Streptomyces harbinensis]|uniref:transcriptional regulator n=1 Tax=Streptomyces harbinensis TaxID=1176198 RepID=UPI0034DFA6F8